MGKVIALPLSRKIATALPDGGTADIHFFTGVRYYRMSEEEFAKLARPAPQRRTKTKVAVAKTALTKTAAPSRKLRKFG